MSDNDYMDEARAARIDEQLDEVHRFLRDLIDDPTPLQVIPNGSTLRHRTIQWKDQRVQLTAHRLSESDEPWTARVTSWDSPRDLGLDVFPSEGAQNKPASSATNRHPEASELLVQTAETAEAALDALERVILQQQAQVASV